MMQSISSSWRSPIQAATAYICLAGVAVLLGGCGEWPTVPREDQDALVIGETLFGAGRVHWFVPDSVGAWTMHPLLDGPRVYFERDLPLSPSGAVLGTAELRALDRATGALLWKAPIVSAHNAALAGGSVGAVWGGLPIFERTSGAAVQTFRYATALSGNLVSDGARFYVGSHDGHVLAVDPLTGTPQWERRVAGAASTPVVGVALDGEALAVTLRHFSWNTAQSDSAIVAVLDRATGETRWRLAHAGRAYSEPLITQGLVIVRTYRYEVMALDLETGALRWQENIAFQNLYDGDGLTACGGLVIVATGDLGVIALDASTGATRWRLVNVQNASLRRLECSHGTVLVLGSVLQVVDARTGAARARYPLRVPREPRREFMITNATRDEESLYIGTTFGYARVAAP